MAPDPASNPVDATLYFRCRKCRQLLFTDAGVLQHQLGEGRGSFARGHRGKRESKTQYHSSEGVLVRTSEMEYREKEGEPQAAVELQEKAEEREFESGVEVESQELEKRESAEIEPAVCGKDGDTSERGKREEDCWSEEVVLGGNRDCPAAGIPGAPPWDHTPSLQTEASAMRREVEGLAQQASHSLSLTPDCTSYFIEPVAWMGDTLLGHLEGKVLQHSLHFYTELKHLCLCVYVQILCPKCNCRLGSFSWKGQQCSCGRWLTPAFQVTLQCVHNLSMMWSSLSPQIHKNRVDEVRTLSRRKNADKIPDSH